MDYGFDLNREIVRREMEEERGKIALRSRARASRIAPGERVALRSRISRLLVRTAFAIDPEEGWRVFWKRLSDGSVAIRNFNR